MAKSIVKLLDPDADGSAAPDLNTGFLVVGIGASAGGIEALAEFFAHVPANSGMAYVVILHLSPDHDSQLAEVLQRSANIPVTQVTEGTRIAPDHVYVVPPDRSLSMNEGSIVVKPLKTVEERRAPVDIFFRSLATAFGPNSVGVVLSGTGANGSMGLKRIKEMGGATFAQNPREAQFSDMPRNAIATELIDMILPVADIPAQIITYRDRIGAVIIAEDSRQRTEEDQTAFRDIFTQLRVRTGHDFSNYKRRTMLRRIERRISVKGLEDLESYASYLRDEPQESHALLKDLLISVTNFFRDRVAFEALDRTIMPQIFAPKRSDAIRIWVAGCATGEEAYSIAMLSAEAAEKELCRAPVQIFASDIDERAIAFAREGLYSLNDVADVSNERLRRFFTKEGFNYRIKREIREMVLFANHNVLTDPPFSRLDLLTCRNLMIYFARPAQERALETFHFALNPGGYFFIGSSESVEGSSDLFAPVSKESHIYQSRQATSRPLPAPESIVEYRPQVTRTDEPLRRSDTKMERASFNDLHLRLLEEYAPPSLVINENHDIVHLSQNAGKYLQAVGGEPTNNLLRIVRPEIRIPLRGAIYKATKEKKQVLLKGLTLQNGSEREVLNISVRPVLNEADTARGFILVIFEPAQKSDEMIAETFTAAEPAVRQLEQELIKSKEQLQSALEQAEIQAEELRASNEELQAMNEELRSSTEELETSREELQSINEELTTVNQELKVKIEELSQTNNNFQNLLASIDIGVIFLDRNLRVNLFSPAAGNIFNLITKDTGRPLSDITNKLLNVDLEKDAERVLEKLTVVEREVETRDGRTYMMRMFPYRTIEDRINGVVITLIDISGRRRVEEDLRASEEFKRLILQSAKGFAIFTIDKDRHVSTWNAGAEEICGYAEQEILGKSGDILFTPEDRNEGAPEKEAKHAAKHGAAINERWHVRKDGSRFYGSGMSQPLKNKNGKIIGFVKIMRDLTEQKRAEQALSEAHQMLEQKVEERTRELKQLTEELEQQVRERTLAEARVREILVRLVDIQEEERHRIARNIHDHLGQHLTGLRINLTSLTAACLQYEDLHSHAEMVQKIAEDLDSSIDAVTWEFRPVDIDTLGLSKALKNLTIGWSRRFGLRADYHAVGPRLVLPPDVEVHLYRITQEALHNVFKHAEASRAGVILERRKDSIRLVIEDDGNGFDLDAPRPVMESETEGERRSLGLVSMRERATLMDATLEIESEIGQGTTVIVRVPVNRA